MRTIRFSAARWLALLMLAALATLAVLSASPASAHELDQSSEFHLAAGVDEQYEQDEMNERMQPGSDLDHDSEKGERIPPVVLDGSQDLDPHQLAPIDPASIEITTVTPADRFVRATTPLLAALTLGALGMLGLAIAQAVRKRSPSEIRLGE